MGKALQAYVKESLQVDFRELDLLGYNAVVLAVVRQKLDNAIHQVGIEKLKKDMDELLGETAPAEIKLSELLVEFKAWARRQQKYAIKRSDVCTIHIGEREYGSRWIYLDPAKVEKYQCKFRMLVREDGEVSQWTLDGMDPKNALFLGPLYGFEKRMFQMYAAGTRLIIDTHDGDGTLPEDEDENVDEFD